MPEPDPQEHPEGFEIRRPPSHETAPDERSGLLVRADKDLEAGPSPVGRPLGSRPRPATPAASGGSASPPPESRAAWTAAASSVPKLRTFSPQLDTDPRS